jgi:hypothetical protein
MPLRTLTLARSRLLRHAALCILIVANFSAASYACSCSGYVHTCDYLQADAVFVGTVTVIVPMTRMVEGRPWPGYYMTFAVQEALKGKLGKQVEVGTNQGGGDCGTPLQPGDRYLIFASKGPEGKLWTGLCSSNQPLPDDADVESIVGPVRKAVTPGKGSLYGIVTYEATGTWDAQGKLSGNRSKPVADLMVRAASEKKTFTTTTGADGKYEFKDLPNGHYTVTPNLRDAWAYDQTWYADRYEKNVADGSCAKVEFQMHPTTRLKGRVTVLPGQQFGAPLDGTVGLQMMVAIPIGLQETNWRSGIQAVVQADGAFDFWPMPPGDYYVGINITSAPSPQAPYVPTYYPGVTDKKAAKIVHIEEGETKYIEFPPPAFAAQRTVHLVAIGPDGKPLSKVRVQREDLQHPGDSMNSMDNVNLDASGAGTTFIYSGIAYHLHATAFLDRTTWCSAPAVISAGSDPVDVRFVMDRSDNPEKRQREGRYRSDCDIVVVDNPPPPPRP